MKASFQADNPDKARHDAAKRYAAEMGQELLTPLAARALFGLSPESVRTAARKGHVDVPFTLDASGRDVQLIRLDSALEYWNQRKPPDLTGELAKMRENGQVMSVSNVVYTVLHPVPLVRMKYPADFGEEDR